MAVTIKDVAREARVSVASVSRALNGHQSMTERTRGRILGVAASLRYIPHANARSLITRRTHTIGALLPDLHGEFFSELIRGIDLAARARGLHLLVSSSHGDAAEAGAALRALQGRVDGLLVMWPHLQSAFLHDNLPDTLPTVLLNTAAERAGSSILNVDNYGGARAMTQHLRARGYRRVAMIGGPDGNFDAGERLRGYHDALAEGSAQPQVIAGDFTEESGHRAGKLLLGMPQRPQAVFAANDMMAVGCLYALIEAGVRVPHDIALAGFDDIPISRYVNPPLTTVRVRIAELGRSALERLALRLENPDSEQTPPETLGCEIVVRASCGVTANIPVRHKNNIHQIDSRIPTEGPP